MLSLRKLFFDPEPPTEEQLARGRRCLIAEGAAAGVLYSIGTGNFLTGYLGQMGASVSFCALMAMIPKRGAYSNFSRRCCLSGSTTASWPSGRCAWCFGSR